MGNQKQTPSRAETRLRQQQSARDRERNRRQEQSAQSRRQQQSARDRERNRREKQRQVAFSQAYLLERESLANQSIGQTISPTVPDPMPILDSSGERAFDRLSRPEIVFEP